MKKDIEKKALKVMKTVVKAGMERKNESTSICPVFFHQPKRPQKTNG